MRDVDSVGCSLSGEEFDWQRSRRRARFVAVLLQVKATKAVLVCNSIFGLVLGLGFGGSLTVIGWFE
jgi:hypothetical protein